MNPLAKLRRIERELDAEERIGVAKMNQEWHEFQVREALRRYRQPLIIAQHLGSK